MEHLSDRSGHGDPPRTVGDLVVAREDDEHPALLFEGDSWSWAELVEQARSRAGLLDSLRKPGPFHVGVLLDNVPEYLFLLAGGALAGSTLVGINPTRRGENLARDIRHTDCQMIVTDSHHAALLEGIDTRLAGGQVLVIDEPEYASALADAPSGPLGNRCDPEDLYLLLFTSGSSGEPKAVRMTHRRATRASDSPICARRDVPYCAMPLHHGNVLNAAVFPAMRTGATIALKRRFSASDFIGDVRRMNCTYTSTIGRVLTYILATPERRDDADNDLAFVLAPESSAADMAEFQRRFGCPVFSGYGSSENAIVLQPPPPSTPGALGVAADDDDIVVVDPETAQVCPTARFDADGLLVNADEAVGELVNRNPRGRFEGYYDDPEAEAERTRNGWYWSGDLAYQDSDEVFWFAGRTADWIRVDGENFTTAPIERILMRFADARGVCVYGVPDVRNAEDQVMVALELHDGIRFDPQAFSDFLGEQPDLGTKWAPRYVRIVGALPVTGNNKIDRSTLRAQAWNCTDQIWWRRDRRQRNYERFAPDDRAEHDSQLQANRRIRLRPK